MNSPKTEYAGVPGFMSGAFVIALPGVLSDLYIRCITITAYAWKR